MKVILTESQYNRVILKEQEVEATADDDLIKIVKEGIAYLYRLEVNKLGQWLSIDVNFVDLAKKILKYIHPLWRTEEQALLNMEFIEVLLNKLGQENVDNIKLDDGTELKLTLKKTYKV